MNLPSEITNKIFSYMSSPTSHLIKQSYFYNSDYTFALLNITIHDPSFLCKTKKKRSVLNLKTRQDYYEYYKLQHLDYCKKELTLKHNVSDWYIDYLKRVCDESSHTPSIEQFQEQEDIYLHTGNLVEMKIFEDARL